MTLVPGTVVVSSSVLEHVTVPKEGGAVPSEPGFCQLAGNKAKPIEPAGPNSSASFFDQFDALAQLVSNCPEPILDSDG